MYGADGDPMIPPYSSFSIRITAMWAGAPLTRCAVGEGWRWIGTVAPAPESTLLEPQAVSVTKAHIAAICGIRGRNMRIARGMSFGFCRREPG